MADLDTLSALFTWCQERKLTPRALCVGAIRVELDAPTPARPVTFDVEAPTDSRDEARRTLETLLHSSGADVGALMSRLG